MAKLLVRDLMTSRAFSIKPKASLLALRDLMDEKDIRHVPVVDEEARLIGLVSQRDLLRSAVGPVSEMPITTQVEIMQQVKVADIMTRDVETVGADQLLAVAAQIMLENKYGCLPVVEEDRVIGILTEADFVRHLAKPADERRVEGRVPSGADRWR
jgi:CBS domain-containing membrane protein